MSLKDKETKLFDVILTKDNFSKAEVKNMIKSLLMGSAEGYMSAINKYKKDVAEAIKELKMSLSKHIITEDFIRIIDVLKEIDEIFGELK